MKSEVQFGNKTHEFELKYAHNCSIDMLCDSYKILNISENGLFRYDKLPSTLSLPINSEGKIMFSTHHNGNESKIRVKGKNDIVLNMYSSGNVIYITTKINDYRYLLRINENGLYLWVDNEHQLYCITTSEAGTILLLE